MSNRTLANVDACMAAYLAPTESNGGSMKARPILMHGRSIRALLDGRKTQTRRIVKRVIREKGLDHYSIWEPSKEIWRGCNGSGLADILLDAYPYGQPGNFLWVREAWSDEAVKGNDEVLIYCADDDGKYEWQINRWKPSIHMPRWANRITLQLTDVRVERMQEINEWDAQREGCGARVDYSVGRTYCTEFSELWDATNGPGAWDRNDWVWVLSFRVIHANIDNVLTCPDQFGIKKVV